jgi:DNA-binding PadR family transcriptional regulator
VIYYVLRYYVARSRVRAVSKARPQQARENDPPLLILTSLATGDKHGYALIQDIESFAGVRLGPGTLYGAIGRLEARGLIQPVPAVGRTRPYRLTPDGREELEKALSALAKIVDEARARLRQAPRLAPAGGLT